MATRFDHAAALACKSCRNAGRVADVRFAGRVRLFRKTPRTGDATQYRVKCRTCGREWWTLAMPADVTSAAQLRQAIVDPPFVASVANAIAPADDDTADSPALNSLEDPT